MSRFKTRTSQFLIDVSVLLLAFFLAMLVRFDWDVPSVMFRQLVIVLPYVVLLQYAFLSGFGITRFLASRVSRGATLACAMLFGFSRQ
jgi:hypothetical protein